MKKDRTNFFLKLLIHQDQNRPGNRKRIIPLSVSKPAREICGWLPRIPKLFGGNWN
jgi:hypothetical protein